MSFQGSVQENCLPLSHFQNISMKLSEKLHNRWLQKARQFMAMKFFVMELLKLWGQTPNQNRVKNCFNRAHTMKEYSS